MLRKEDVIRLLKQLPFDESEYWVASGAALVLCGVREETRDIDLGCTSAPNERLVREGYAENRFPDGSRRIIYSDEIEIFENRIEGETVMTEGFPAVSLDGIIRMKEKLGREKDLKDIALIKEFMKKSRPWPGTVYSGRQS